MHPKLVASATICAAVLAASVTAPPATGARAAQDKAWTGYSIPDTANAAGGWIGGRVLDNQQWYRIDPTAKPGARSYAAPRASKNVRGDAAATARVAWTISKYGHYRDKVQSAAVDAATYHLLVGGAWRIQGAQGNRRIQQTGDPARVRSYARFMIDQSAQDAGPYRLTLATNTPTIGQTATVTATLRSRAGKPVTRIPVAISYDGIGSGSSFTDERGQASWDFPAKSAGPHAVRVTASKLPPVAVQLRSPGSAGTRIITADKGSQAVSATAAIRATPSVVVRSSAPTVDRGSLAGGLLRVQGKYGASEQRGTVRLIGPFSTPGAVSCDGPVAKSWPVSVRGNGSTRLPSPRPTPGGYIWSVSVPADRYNAAAEGCGGRFGVYLTPTLRARSTSKSVKVGATPRPRLQVTGVPAGFASTGRVAVFGPFSSRKAATRAKSCAKGTRAGVTAVPIKAGTQPGPRLKVKRAGLYVWRLRVAGATWTRATDSPCGAGGSLFRVR